MAASLHAYRKPTHEPSEYVDTLTENGVDPDEFAEATLAGHAFRDGDLLVVVVLQNVPAPLPTVYVYKAECGKPRLLSESEH